VDGLDLAANSEANYDAALNTLRRGLEADRFGVVAHVFGQQPNCLPQQCEMLVLLRDANKVRVNLQDKPFEALVAKYSPQWSQPRIAERNPGMPPPPSAPAPLSSRFELPSSASIPPVSIMNTEPSPPVGSSQSAASPPASSSQSTNPNATGTTATPPRRPPAVRAPVARAPGEPVPPAPSASNPPAAAAPAPAVR